MGNYLCFCKNYYIPSELSFDSLNFDDIEYFSLDNREFTAKVVDVYDGDTCSIIIKLSNEYVKFKCRCLGYDSPEMKPPKDCENRDEIISNANKAKNFFINQVTDIELDENIIYDKKDLKDRLLSNHKLIKIKTYKWDKYGRILTEFYNKNVNVNNVMIEKGYGYPYDGGTKRT